MPVTDMKVGVPRGTLDGWVSRRKDREGLSLSLAGHCRMELWLIHKGRKPEAVTPSAERVFEYGDVIELLVFDDLTVQTARGPESHGSWWSRLRSIIDPAYNAVIYTAPLQDRQKVVVVDGIEGHMDATTNTKIEMESIEWQGKVVVDSKSANGNSFRNAAIGPLTNNVFSRESVMQMQMYMGAEKAEFACLVYSDKEKGGLMCRIIPFDPKLFEEGRERLRTAQLDAEPVPDHQWVKGEQIPLRCGYCSMKFECAKTRGQMISEPTFNNRGAPQWWVMS